jgi:hypothetical protein
MEKGPVTSEEDEELPEEENRENVEWEQPHHTIDVDEDN